MTLSESWAATRPVSSQILLPLIVIALAVGLIGQVILLIFGQTVTVDMFGTMQEQVVLSLPGQIVNGIMSLAADPREPRADDHALRQPDRGAAAELTSGQARGMGQGGGMTDRTADLPMPPAPLRRPCGTCSRRRRCRRTSFLSERYGAEIWLKREDLSPVRSYKIRGAFNAMRKIRATDPTATRFICASAGNHAQGVAFVCAHFGVTGRIYMPVTTPEQKILKTKTFGGDASRSC
jgi:hypothetical protein